MKAATIYILAVLLAQLTATLFIPLPIFGAVAVGTFIFGVTFTQRDHMHRHGKPFVYKIIFLAAALSLLLLLWIGWSVGESLSGFFANRDWGAFSNWLSEGYTLLSQSSWRVFLASVIAIIIAESMDTEVYHQLRDRSWMVRVLRSNAVSVPTDSILFNVIAFAGVFSPSLLIKVTIGEIVVKALVSVGYAYLAQPKEPEPGASTTQAPKEA